MPPLRPRRRGLALWFVLAAAGPAAAVEAVRVPVDAPVLDLTNVVERNKSDGDVIQISTAPGPDGIVRRIAVRARESGARPDWIVFALTNDSDEQIDRLLVAPFHRLIGSGVIWPDLGDSRIEAVTASQGLSPEREASPDADVFLITLDPGTTVTFVAELKSSNLPQLYLYEQEAYRQKTNGLTLYKGIIIGIAGLLALFLTIIFVVKGAVIFPAAAALAWAVLAYAGLDFGFFQRIFPLTPAIERIYRAGAEVGARGDAARLPLRLSQPGALACALQPRHHRLDAGAGGAGRAGRRRCADGLRHRAHLDRSRCGGRLRADPASRHPWL